MSIVGSTVVNKQKVITRLEPCIVFPSAKKKTVLIKNYLTENKILSIDL